MFTFDDDFDTTKDVEETVEESTEEVGSTGSSFTEEGELPLIEEALEGEHTEEPEEEPDYSDLGIDEHEEYIIRMSKNERVQHLLLFVCVTMLVITGFSLRIPIDYITKLGKFGSTYFWIRGYVHRFFGTLLLATTVYHFLHMAFTSAGRLYLKRMIPRIKDVTDGIHNISFMIGFSKEPPKMEWFDYKEKIEYWALQAGTMLVGGTGIILWSHRRWPQLAVNLAYLIHGMEAVLATGAIIIWHFYYVHFKPGQFPMNRTWIDGKMSLAHLKHEHRAVYDRYMAERAKEIRGEK
jgi:cytochrome b subunit of formate dehydrogenase